MQANHDAIFTGVLSRPAERRDDLGRLVRVAGLVAKRMRDRRVLAHMEDRLLEDVGLVPDEVARRLRRPF